jgi:anti-sigma regulatory factor (Ser/Thr protein kinase)
VIEPKAVPVFRWLHRSELVLGAVPIATPCARLRTRSALAEWGLRDQADTIELIVSELVTNAIHNITLEDGLACIQLRLSSDRLVTLVEVWDESLRPPVPAQDNPEAEGGRGLTLVEALSDRWGWDLAHEGRGKIVWALVECRQSRSDWLFPGHGS